MYLEDHLKIDQFIFVLIPKLGLCLEDRIGFGKTERERRLLTVYPEPYFLSFQT